MALFFPRCVSASSNPAPFPLVTTTQSGVKRADIPKGKIHHSAFRLLGM